jgi:hypothetical protein
VLKIKIEKSPLLKKKKKKKHFVVYGSYASGRGLLSYMGLAPQMFGGGGLGCGVARAAPRYGSVVLLLLSEPNYYYYKYHL